MKDKLLKHKALIAFLIVILSFICINWRAFVGLSELVGFLCKMSYQSVVPPSPLKYGFIDKTGKFVIEPKFDKVGRFSEDLAYACINKKCGFIDETGKFIIKPQFKAQFIAPCFRNGVAILGDFGVPSGIINKSGKYILKNVEFIEPSLSSNLIRFKVNAKDGYVNTKGEIVIKPQFSSSNNFSEGLAAFRMELHDKWGFINEDGKITIKPQFDYAYGFGNGLAAVEVNNKWGFIDKTGNFVIKPQYDGGGFFRNGTASEQIRGKHGLINTKGEFIIPPKFENILFFNKEGIAPAKLNGKYGFINKSGEFTIKPQFQDASGFCNGLSPVKINNKWGFIDNTGKVVIKPQFEEARGCGEGLTYVASQGLWYVAIDYKTWLTKYKN